MESEWQPAEGTKQLHTRVAFDDEQIRFRFRWDQPDPGGWIHDMLVYHDGQWRQFADPSPWVSDRPEHTGFYEDRISFFLDDGSVRGFEAFGGWLTTHDGMRSLPSAASAEAVQTHPHYGAEGLDKTDIRKYIPQACEGEWWESDWSDVPKHTHRLVFPGVETWTDLVCDGHPRSEDVRTLSTTMWRLHQRAE
jgi:hypothetical protein